MGWAAAHAAARAAGALSAGRARSARWSRSTAAGPSPRQGTTVYIADNGIHTDIIMPVKAQGLDWSPLLPRSDFAAPDPERALDRVRRRASSTSISNTPTWWDITPRTIWSALAGGTRVIHVEYVPSPDYAAREIRLRPEEYRRLWAAVRAELRAGPSRPTAADRSSRLRIGRRLLPGDGKGKHVPHLQQLGRRPAAPRRRKDQPLAALHQRAAVALPHDAHST